MTASTETGVLILKSDATDITKAGVELDKLTVAADGASKSVDNLAESSTKAEAAAVALATATKEGGAAVSEVDKAASAASEKIKILYSPQITQSARSFREEQQEIILGMLGYGTAVERVAAISNTSADIAARGATLMAAEDRARKAATIGVAEQTGALSKLLGQIDPTVAGYERLDAMQAKLAAFRKSGAISGDDYVLFSGKIAGMRGEIDKAGEATHKLTLNSAMARREFGRMGTDLAMGNYGRLAQTSMTLANYTGVLGKVFSATGLSILGVTAIVGGFTASLFKAAAANAELQKAIILSGNASGMTAEQMKSAASSYATYYTTASKVLELQKGLIATGSVNAQTFRAATQAAIAFGEATGQSQEQVIKTFDELAKDPVNTLEKINQLYGWITPAVMDHVRALADQGDKAQAVAEAFRAINSAASDTASAEQKASTTIDRLIAKWKHGAAEISGYYQKLVNGISPTEQFQIARSTYELHLQSTKRNSPLDRLFGQVFTPEQLQAEEAKLKAMAATLQAQRDAAGLGAQATEDNKAGNTVNSYYDNHFATLDKVAKKQKELNDLTATYEQMWAHTDGNNPRLKGVQRVIGADGKASFVGGNFDRDAAAINAKFAEHALKGPKAPDLTITPPPDFLSTITDGYKKELAAQAKATLALEDYRQVQEAKLRTSQEALDLQVKSIGMGDREIAMEREIISIHREADQDLQRLNKQRSSMTQDQYDAQLAIIKEYEDRRVAAAHDADDRIRAAQSQWQNGFTRAFDNYIDQASDVAGQSAELFTNAFNGMGDSLANFATTGKMNFKGLVTSILSDLAKMEMRIAMSKILQQVVGMFAGSYGAEGTNSTSSIGTDSSGGSINFISHVGGRASGGPVSAGSMYEVAEGGRPELLNTGGRTFLMMGSQGGDVTPAKRGGSAVSSGGGAVNIYTTVNVDSNGSAKSQTSSDSSDAMARALAAQMEAKAKEVVMRATQPGGILWKQRVGA